MRLRVALFTCATIVMLFLSACGGGEAAPPPSAAADIPVTLSASGNAEEGKLVYENQGCTGCHSTGTDKLVGPGLAGLFSGNGPTLPDGVDYKGNLPNGQPRTEENIAAWIRNGGQGQIGVMSGREVSDEDMADLLAYLRTLK
ncbi:MAG: hypothetical protein Fur005_40890 [Roseiflexaceae bacterium]